MRESLPNKCVFNIAEITPSRNRLHCMTSCLNLHSSCISVTFDGVNCEMSEYTDLTTCSADRVGIRSYYLANITTDMVNNLDEGGFSASTTAVVPQSTVIRRLAPSHSLNLVQGIGLLICQLLLTFGVILWFAPTHEDKILILSDFTLITVC